MCKVFPSSLNPIPMRWFDGLEEGSISSYKELTKAFGARFVTCSRVPRPLDSLLSMSMREGETLKNYSDKYQELCNEIDGDFKDLAVKTFKVGLPTHSDLWKSLTMKRPQNMCQLMDRIEEHKRAEENQSQNKGKARIFTPDRRHNRSDQYEPSCLRREFFSQAPHNPTGPQMVNLVFKEPIYQVLEKIENESYFKWPNKMAVKIKIFTANTIRTEVTLQRIARCCNSFLTNWSNLES